MKYNKYIFKNNPYRNRTAFMLHGLRTQYHIILTARQLKSYDLIPRRLVHIFGINIEDIHTQTSLQKMLLDMDYLSRTDQFEELCDKYGEILSEAYVEYKVLWRCFQEKNGGGK